jgi:alpha-glucosidase
MKVCQSLGMHAVKAGHVADAGGIIAPNDNGADKPGESRMEYHDGQRQVQHRLKVVETAARYEVAINAHDPVKGTGLRRTSQRDCPRRRARPGIQRTGASSRMGPAMSRPWSTPECSQGRWTTRPAS